MLWLLLPSLSWAAPNLVLISMDTTRADALSCYGTIPDAPADAPPVSPNLDALAADGVRFERFYAHAPTTLNSHTSMFSGLDPHGHSVVRNGYVVDPAIPTLAQRLQTAGWNTVAILGSAALESAMGLNRGFDVYDDQLPNHVANIYQASAENVVERALAAIDARTDDTAPLFLFVHFYDAHAPYDAPTPYLDRYTDPDYDGAWRQANAPTRELAHAIFDHKADPSHKRFLAGRYLGAVSYVDAQIGVLLDALTQRGLLDEALVVVTADHGETLADEPQFAWSHGNDVGRGVMRVPLIVHGYGIPLASHSVVERQATMSGLAPTLELALGLDRTLGDGLDFWDLVRPGPILDEHGWPEHPVRPAFSEATRPRQYESTTDWNNLGLYRAVRAGGWGVRGAPAYNFSYSFYTDDHGEHEALRPTLMRMLNRWDADSPAHREPQMAPTTQKALEALGYLDAEDANSPADTPP